MTHPHELTRPTEAELDEWQRELDIILDLDDDALDGLRLIAEVRRLRMQLAGRPALHTVMEELAQHYVDIKGGAWLTSPLVVVENLRKLYRAEAAARA